MTRMRQYLPYAELPKEDRGLWNAAFKKGERLFDDCGPGAHLSERSQQQLQYAYAKFLKFVSVRHPDRLGCDPAARVSVDMIEEFVKFQPATCGDVTISIYLYHLWLVLKYIYPASDWSWLVTISARIAARGREKRKKYHLVTSETLYALGIAHGRCVVEGQVDHGEQCPDCLSRRSHHRLPGAHSLAASYAWLAADRVALGEIWGRLGSRHSGQ